jgi:hypothetical protein
MTGANSASIKPHDGAANLKSNIFTAYSRIVRHSVSSLRSFCQHRYHALPALKRLGTTPMYYVANKRGNAFLQEDVQTNNPEQKVVVYFMSSEDANDYLEEMAQSNPSNAQEFQLATTTLEKVVDNIAIKKQSKKLGRHPMDVIYRIQPSVRQVENAASLTVPTPTPNSKYVRATAEKRDKFAIPTFSAAGMLIKRRSGELITPYYFALEDLEDDWSRLISTSENGKQPKVKVHDFTEVMCLAQGISHQSINGNDFGSAIETLTKVTSAPKEGMPITSTLGAQDIKYALENPGFVPPRREIEMMKRLYRHQQGLPGEFSKAKLTIRGE